MADELESLKAALAERYAIERELGAGGMATVYLARGARHNRDVAVLGSGPSDGAKTRASRRRIVGRDQHECTSEDIAVPFIRSTRRS